MKITVFQALTLLAQKYRNDMNHQDTYQTIKALYLSGIRSPEDEATLNQLLQNEALTGYQVSDSKMDIHRDPTRRYFESHLCLETLDSHLDSLDMDMLEANFNAFFSKLPADMQILAQEYIYQNKNMEYAQKISGFSNEYGEGIRILNEEGSYPHLKPKKGKHGKTPNELFKERKAKMTLLGKSSHAGALAGEKAPQDSFPLNLYHKKDYVFDPKNRGRKPKKHTSEECLKPRTRGIMKCDMPLPQHDPLLVKEADKFPRPSDYTDYVDGAQQPEKFFSTKVTPFSNSISGTMLCSLRLMAALNRDKQFVYHGNEAQLKLYFKNFVAYMLYYGGGHSLYEFMSVLELPEVQEEFKDLPGFSELTLDQLFKDENEIAFDKTLDKTFVYNNVIMNKQQLQEEVAPNQDVDTKISEIKCEDFLTHLTKSPPTQPEKILEIGKFYCNESSALDKAVKGLENKIQNYGFFSHQESLTTELLTPQESTALNHTLTNALSKEYHLSTDALAPLIQSSEFKITCNDEATDCEVLFSEKDLNKIQELIITTQIEQEKDKANPTFLASVNPSLTSCILTAPLLGLFALAVYRQWSENPEPEKNKKNLIESQVLKPESVKVFKQKLSNDLQVSQEKLNQLDQIVGYALGDVKFLMKEFAGRLTDFTSGKTTVGDLNDVVYMNQYIQKAITEIEKNKKNIIEERVLQPTSVKALKEKLSKNLQDFQEKLDQFGETTEGLALAIEKFEDNLSGFIPGKTTIGDLNAMLSIKNSIQNEITYLQQLTPTPSM